MSPSTRIILIVVLVLASIMAVSLAFKYDHDIRKALVADQGKNWKKTTDYKLYTSVRKFGDYPQILALGVVGLLIAGSCAAGNGWYPRGRHHRLHPRWHGRQRLRLTTGRTRPRESPKIEQGFYGPWHNGKLSSAIRGITPSRPGTRPRPLASPESFFSPAPGSASLLSYQPPSLPGPVSSSGHTTLRM